MDDHCWWFGTILVTSAYSDAAMRLTNIEIHHRSGRGRALYPATSPLSLVSDSNVQSAGLAALIN
jgi:hypothetical protein